MHDHPLLAERAQRVQPQSGHQNQNLRYIHVWYVCAILPSGGSHRQYRVEGRGFEPCCLSLFFSLSLSFSFFPSLFPPFLFFLPSFPFFPFPLPLNRDIVL